MFIVWKFSNFVAEMSVSSSSFGLKVMLWTDFRYILWCIFSLCLAWLYQVISSLQIRELEDRKKIQTLLTLSGLTEREVSYFMKEPPALAIVEQKLPPKLKNSLQRDTNTKGNVAE